MFQRVFSGPDGLDPYALAVSDVYQDLFEEGSYCGKGIYDVDIFETALQGQIPESTVLSHDLLEGIFSRAGLSSDIEVVEEFPTRYSVSAARQHRWVRGDWQLLPWIFGFIPKGRDGSRRTTIPLMGRWNLLDNLRRSLSAPSALLALLISWMLPLPIAETWTAFIVLTIALPPLIPVIVNIVPRRTGVTFRNHLRALGSDLAQGLMQSAFLITFLAHQAWIMVDAVARTLFRMLVVRRRLLEWVTAAQLAEDNGFDRRRLMTQILASVTFAIVVGIGIYHSDGHTWPIAVPFAALWILSPIIARRASQAPRAAGHLSIGSADRQALRLIARRTWRFFEKFVTPQDNMLPPDNFQEDPEPVIAHRTSPTNIGLYLLSVVAARDFGWLGTLDTLDRLEATFATLEKMERYRGHFYNWYDSSDLRPLEPKYVSSVDSGNLAGHLIALSNACREFVGEPVYNPNWIAGLEDCLALVAESAAGKALSARLADAIDAFGAGLKSAPANLGEVAAHFANLATKADAIVAIAEGQSGVQKENTTPELVYWAKALRSSITSHQRDLEIFAPWAGLAKGEAGNETPSHPDINATLASLVEHCETKSPIVANGPTQGRSEDDHATLTSVLVRSISTARLIIHRTTALADSAKSSAMSMEFGFMFDSGRQLLSIGYRCNDGTLDPNFYDLLASEARLASFFAIAKGDLPAKHWFSLGRTLTPIDGSSGLISWSGSMFEYLMPSLVMRAPSGSLLEQTNRLIVRRQEKFGDELGVPWGMSESEYYARDIQQTYQYSSFGIPDLGYKRGLAENTVIAPYASGLASMIDPSAAARNFKRMAGIGARGAYGWYEAIDYTRSRLPEDVKFAIVRAYMSHHQGMAIVGIANALDDGRMRSRFHSEPIIQATELLLQERMPRDIAMARTVPEKLTVAAQIESLVPEIQRRYTSAHSRVPRTQLLSNGRYSTMVTASGSGYSRWNDIAITRWREDVTCDGWGAYIFLRDVRTGETWSTGYQPSLTEPNSYEVIFSEDRAEIIRGDGNITTMLEVAISPEDDAEVRRVSITNHGSRARELDITSYAEVALARQADDIAHPAFAKLFVETEFTAGLGAIVATRRQRSSGDPKVWAAHLSVVEGDGSGDVQFETDRGRFLGRGQTIQHSAAISDGWPLSNTAGAVLDPIFSLRRRVKIPRGATGANCVPGPWLLRHGKRSSISRTSTTTPAPLAAPRHLPGPKRKCNSIISVSEQRTPIFSSASPIMCSIPTRHCGRSRTPSSGALARFRRCGRREFPVTFPSCWSASKKMTTLSSCANYCARMNIGVLSSSPLIW